MNTVGNVERTVCVFCLNILAVDSMKPNKLRRHLETLHPSYVSKPLEFFHRKLDEYRQQAGQKALLASYKVAHHIARCKKPHTKTEELKLLAALHMVTIMLVEKSA